MRGGGAGRGGPARVRGGGSARGSGAGPARVRGGSGSRGSGAGVGAGYIVGPPALDSPGSVAGFGLPGVRPWAPEPDRQSTEGIPRVWRRGVWDSRATETRPGWPLVRLAVNEVLPLTPNSSIFGAVPSTLGPQGDAGWHHPLTAGLFRLSEARALQETCGRTNSRADVVVGRLPPPVVCPPGNGGAPGR